MRNKEQTILKRALQELLECETGCVPPASEIKKKHIFSGDFLDQMDQIIRRQEEKQTEKRFRFWRMPRQAIAACVVCVIVAASCVAVVQSGMFRAGSGAPAQDMSSAGAGSGAADAADGAIPQKGASEAMTESAQDIDDLMEGDQAAGAAFFTEAADCNEEQVTILLSNYEAEPLTLQLLSIRKTGEEEAVVYEDAYTDMCYLVEAGDTSEVIFDRASYGIEEAGTYVFEWVTSDEVTYWESYELD